MNPNKEGGTLERTIVVRVDDFDKTTKAEQHIIALDDERWAIDLHDAHHGELLEALARFTKVARSLSKPVKMSPEQLAAIRHWCRAHADQLPAGLVISDYGVIPRPAMEAFTKAHPSRGLADAEVAEQRSKRMFSDG